MKNDKYFISVGEPWDFESPDGQNIIKGNILCIKSNLCLVFQANHYLKFDNVESDVLIVFPRHLGSGFSNLGDRPVVINGSLLCIEYDEMMSEKKLHDNARLIIIGSLRKE